jgi:hypothetical protein
MLTSACVAGSDALLLVLGCPAVWNPRRGEVSGGDPCPYPYPTADAAPSPAKPAPGAELLVPPSLREASK